MWTFRIFSYISLIGIFLSLLSGCSSGGSGPTSPDSDARLPLVQDRLISSTTIGPDGGTIDLGWFVLILPENYFSKDATVELYETRLKNPHQGVIVGGYPIRVAISGANVGTDSFYTCTFILDKLPSGSGIFVPENEFVDIVAEWDESGKTAIGNAWAKRVENSISHLIQNDELTLALVDYQNIPELIAEPIFTDDPRELTGPYARLAQSIPFHEDNLGPLGDRIPVIFIHA